MNHKPALLVLFLISCVLAPGAIAASAESPWSVMWSVEGTGRYYASPALADLNGDGRLEIIAAAAGHEHRMNAFRSDGSLLWSFSAAGELQSSPAVGDLDGDASLEVLQADVLGYLYCLRADGALRWVRSVPEGVQWGSVGLVGLANGKRMAVAGSTSKGLFAFSPDGDLLWRFDVGGSIGAPLAAADLDADGNDEIFQGGGKHLFCLSANGRRRWAIPLTGAPDAGPAVADVNGDGRLEVVFADAEKNLRCVRADNGEELWRFAAPASVDCAIGVADLDGDSRLAVVFGDTGGHLHRLDSEGRRVWSIDTGGPVFSEPVIVPVPGPERCQITYLTRAGTLEGVSPSGERLWSVKVAGDAPSTPALADLDGDGKAELIVGTYSRQLICFKSSLPYRNGDSLWAMRRRGGVQLGCALTPAQLLTPSGQLPAPVPARRVGAAIDWSGLPDPLPMGEAALSVSAPAARTDDEGFTVVSVRMPSGRRSTCARLTSPPEPTIATAFVDEAGSVLVEAQVLDGSGTRVLARDFRRLRAYPFAAEHQQLRQLLAELAEQGAAIAAVSPKVAEALSGWFRQFADQSGSWAEQAERLSGRPQEFNRLPYSTRRSLIEQVKSGLAVLRREAERARFAAQYLTAAERKDTPVALGRESGLVKIFRDEPTLSRPLLPGKEAIEMCAARGEAEGAQLVVMPLWRDLEGVEVSLAGDLTGPQGASIAGAQVTVNPVGYVNCPQPPYPVERVGWWPDPLMPAGPTDCRAGEVQPIWVTVNVPREAKPGDYEGFLLVTAKGDLSLRVPLRVRVWNFALPHKPALETEFGIGYYPDWFANPPGYEAMRRQYLDFLLRHRLSTASTENSDLDLVLERGATSINVGPDNQALYEEMKRRGLLPMTYSYIIDEPPAERFDEVKRVYSEARKKIPGVRLLCTVAPQRKELHGYIDLWVPILNDYQEGPARARQRLGEQVWWYVCLFPYPDYPNYFIDYQPIRQRILSWMNWKYGVTGILYWSTTYGWTTNPPKEGERWPEIPWNTNSYMDYNGDGSLIYPGPNGEPLSSIRLEAIRDSVDDYDYFALLKQLMEEAKARGGVDPRLLARAESLLRIPESMVKDTKTYTHDPSILLNRRDEMGETLSELWRSLRPEE
jgi:outer membrane protein assembly factor BamB